MKAMTCLSDRLTKLFLNVLLQLFFIQHRVIGSFNEKFQESKFLCPSSKKEGHIALHMLVNSYVCRSPLNFGNQ